MNVEYFNRTIGLGRRFRLGRFGGLLLGLVLQVTPALSFDIGRFGTWWPEAADISVPLANGGTAKLLGTLRTDAGIIAGYQFGYVNAAGVPATVVTSGPSASLVNAQIEPLAGKYVYGKATVNVAAARAGLLARSVAWATSLPATALALGLTPSPLADATFSAAIPADWNQDWRDAAFLTGLTRGCSLLSKFGNTFRNVPCIDRVYADYVAVYEKDVCLTVASGAFQDCAGPWTGYPIEEYASTNNPYTFYKNFPSRVGFVSPDAYEAELDAALQAATDTQIAEVIATTLMNGEMQQLPPDVFNPIPVPDVAVDTPVTVTNPAAYPEFQLDNAYATSSAPASSGSSTVNVTFPDQMDVNVQNWPNPVEVLPAQDAQVDRWSIPSPFLDVGSGWLPAACPAPRTFETRFGGGEIGFEPICDAVSLAGPILVGIGFLLGLGIVFGSKI